MTARSVVRSGLDLRRLPVRHLVLAAVLPLILLGMARHFGQFTASSLEAKIAAIMGGE